MVSNFICFRYVASSLCALALSACSSSSNQGSGTSSFAPAIPAAQKVASASENLYVLYAGANAVVVYTHNGKQVLRTITDGIHSPDAMAIDSQGTLYVGNLDHSSSGAVKVYPPGTSTPTTTITVRGRQVLACDASGNLYIGTDKTNVINVYSNQGTTLVRTLTGIRRPVAIAFDAVGNVYAGNVVGINVYEAGGTKLLRTIPSTDAYALAFDSTGELYVLSAENETVEEFAPNGSVPDRTITEQDGLYYPNAIALDDHNYLYVANCGTCQESTPGNVTVYAPKQTSVSRTIDRGVDGPYAIAYDNPDFYVGNRRPETVTMYRHGKPRLVRTISPPSGYGVAIVIEFGP